jgi:tetratricopeptide (TPR) repeat protein
MAPDPAVPDNPPALAIQRLLRRLESKDLDARIAALERERREAPGLVAELLALPEPRRSAAATSARYATPEVVWQLMEISRDQPPPAALAQLGLTRQIALHLAARRPEAALHVQLRVEVSCEIAHRLLDDGDADAAVVPLEEAAAALRPDLGYGRALYCRALARVRRAEHRWEEALALAERAVRLLGEHGAAAEAAAAEVEHGWLLFDAGDADEAVPVFEKALARVEPIPRSAVTCRLGLAIALLESGQGADRPRIDRLLADAEWMIDQASAAGDLPRLRWLAAEAMARYRQATG